MATVDFMTVDQLFNKTFYVPAYQRGYRWDKTQVGELIEDLFNFAQRRTESSYCLQPIIVKERSDSKWELVDGQQRLTALWLIFALYYCSNRRDIRNLVHRKYDLVYEEKDDFTALFGIISRLVGEVDYVDLPSKLEGEKGRSIDSKYLIESIESIIDYQIDSYYSKGILNRIIEVISRITVIWYVLDEEDPIQTFTNVNANKIALTNSELIKAVLLTNSGENEKDNRALQWEEIEKKLNNDSLWNFISRTNDLSTRIDYLFEIICARDNLFDSETTDEGDDDRYKVFRAVSKHLNNETGAANIWRKVQTTYDTLHDWYEDYFFYHMIGLLIIVSDSKPEEIINQLYREYSNSSKTAFKQYVVEALRKIYISDKIFPVLDKEKMKGVLDTLDYDNNKKGYIKKVLLLYNIALLVIADNEYERFPFDLYKTDTWDIEHINPQTPKDATVDEKNKWLSSYRRIINDKVINDLIDQYLENQDVDFDALVDKIEQHFGVEDKDAISNLVLLDSSTNSAYKNACFSDKRRVIIDVERANRQANADIYKKPDKKTKKRYIPIGTKWVFLKGYEKAEDLKVWGPSDMSDYLSDMVNKIYIVLGGV